MICSTLFFVALSLLCYFAFRPYNYWNNRNVKTNKFIPIFGDYYRMILGKESIGEMIQRCYREAKNLRYFGCYLFQFPALMITSPELVKKVCVKNFDHFTNHKNIIPDGIDELWNKNLVSLKGENWKNMRSILSPSFTSSKMKAMFVHISQNANLFAQHFLRMDEETVTVEFKDAFARYTTDVIASAAFGVKVDCLKDRDNEFYVMGKKGSNFTSSWGIFVFTAYQIFPSIAKFFRLRLFEQNIQSFFLNLVRDTIKVREEMNIKRSDMLGLLMEARYERKRIEETEKSTDTKSTVSKENLDIQNSKLELSDSDIASQVFIFFLGGYETVSTAMCLMVYELALNPDVQMKLHEEIIENRKDNDELLYETISNMTYLDMVVSECLRKWPVGAFTDRVVTKPYTIEPEVPGEKTLTLDVDQYVIIPTLAFHHDPKYYEHPEKLIPERFSPENRRNINPYTYFPFGVGPRNCIGSRFALLEIKAVLFHLLSHFEIVPTQETNIPLQIDKSSFNVKSVNGFPLGLKRRVHRQRFA